MMSTYIYETGVYFIRRGTDGPIKIGRSRKIAKRLATLQIGSPERLTLLAVLSGVENELLIHRKFAADCVGGEWFRPSDLLLRLIEQVVAGVSNPDDLALIPPIPPIPIHLIAIRTQGQAALIQHANKLRGGQSAIARVLGKTARSISNICNGVSRPSAFHRLLIEKALGIPEDDWLTDEERVAIKEAAGNGGRAA